MSISWATAATVVKVASGYARNFLLPKRAGRRRHRIEQEDRRAGAPGALRREAKEVASAGDLGKLMGSVSVTIRAKGRRERSAVRIGDRRGYRGRTRKAGLHHRAPQDPAGRADQDAGRIQSVRAPAPGCDHRSPGPRPEGGVALCYSLPINMRMRPSRSSTSCRGGPFRRRPPMAPRDPRSRTVLRSRNSRLHAVRRNRRP